MREGRSHVKDVTAARCPDRERHPGWHEERDRLARLTRNDRLPDPARPRPDFTIEDAGPAGSRDRIAPASVERAPSAHPFEPKLRTTDRLLFVWLYQLFPSVLKAMAIVRPDTIPPNR